MFQKKVCMVGTFAVGKTSLVKQYVESIFSEKYHTTVGVKIDKKQITVDGKDIMLILWDLAGEDEFCKIRHSYLRGASGFILVIDGTRKNTLEKAISIYQKASDLLGDIPFIVAINKCDLPGHWEIGENEIEGLVDRGWNVIKTSAKTGESVESLFQMLASQMAD